MSKEEQKESARRIMEKLGPLTEEEKEILSYNPSPAQWAEAYDRMQEGKERAKAREKAGE